MGLGVDGAACWIARGCIYVLVGREWLLVSKTELFFAAMRSELLVCFV